jgi:ribulose-phosphate 3-epimerase
VWDSIRPVEVEPSLYAADFMRLGEQIEALLAAGARVFHFDVGDGHFVPPVTIGPVVLRSIAPTIQRAGGRLDCHLMVDDPVHHFPEIAESGGDSVTFHAEVASDPAAVAARARELGLGVGVAFNPETGVDEAFAKADAAAADLVLCMSIHPGYSGQEFMPEAVERLRRLRSLAGEAMHVQVDGGVNDETGPLAREAGASLLVAGSAVFREVPGAFVRLAGLVGAGT